MRSPLTVLLLLILTGCVAESPTPVSTPLASPSPTAPGPASPGPASPSPSPAAPNPTSPGPPKSDATAGGPRASFGVDRVRWPGTLNGARAVLRSMPQTVAKTPRKDHYNSGDGDNPARDAGVSYGTFGSIDVYEEYVTTDTHDGKPQRFSANNILATSFGLGLACKKNSYRGTAPKPSYPGGGPAVTRKPVTKPVWFSCVIDGAEGDDDFTGHAVGWTRGKTAWLVVAEDAAAARTLVAASKRAAT